MNTDLFNDKIFIQSLNLYNNNYLSIIDTQKGEWQRRKRRYINLGIKSEIGRGEKINFLNNYKSLAYSNLKNKSGINKGGFFDSPGQNNASIFDPVLCELMYNWFCPSEGLILDPFAGGSVRGIVANYLGYNYTGIELRQEQVDSNREQAAGILPVDRQPQWYVGDSDRVLDGQWADRFDMVFSCPPYADLEAYSDLPDDLSTMDYFVFLQKYRSIIRKSLQLLKTGSFAVWVVGEIRNKQGNYYGFVADTINIFRELKMNYYNECIIKKCAGSKSLLSKRFYNKSKKISKIHENVLVFKKVN